MADSHKPHAAGGREAGSPSHTNSPKRPPLASLSRHRATAYCAHAPDPYAAMASQGDWSTELWDIFAQPGGPNMCCLSLWCPCIQYGLLLEQLPPSHPIHDFFITWCCAPCALCQEAREAVIRQAAEREDQARTPLLMSRSGSVHDKADVSARSSLAGRASSGLVPLGSAHEPMSPGSSAAAPATATASHGGTGIGISEAPSPAALARTSQAYGGQGNQATSPATPNRTSTRAGAVADVVNANVSDGAVSAATAVAAGARMDPAPASANGGDLAAVDVASVLGRS
ncbi:hypothetical protein Vretimale_17133 [Volvox reticuliferus]|uniref:Uncharacterized protein n=1 Tax=Volvox reticuliferus TaxID=1737510 RepID=A0A8J4GSI8_9CHLO|nr:hypothetical protein Vretimale_17133 [Volvox reticuliferus]